MASVLALSVSTASAAGWSVSAAGYVEVPTANGEPDIVRYAECGASSADKCAEPNSFVGQLYAVSGQGAVSVVLPNNNGAAVAQSFAAADLKAGTLRARSLLDNPNSISATARAGAGFTETLHFTISGADESTETVAMVRLSVHGTGDSAAFTFGAQSYDAAFTKVDALNGAYYYNGEVNNSMAGAWTQFGPSDYVGAVKLYGANPVVHLSMSLSTRYTTDYSHTAAFAFDFLPEAATYVSESGLFLSAAAVPEPQTYAMLVTGLGLIGFLARRRRTR